MVLQAVIQTVDQAASVDKVFYTLTGGGSLPGSLLYESQDEFGAFTGFSLGIYQPSICLSGKGEHFCYEALDARGEQLLSHLTLPAKATPLKQTKAVRAGTLKPDVSQSHLDARLNASNHMDLLKALLVPLQVEPAYAHLPLGVFGGFAYDFIRQFESIPKAKQDIMQDDDYGFYLATRLFIVDHNAQKTHLISLVPDDSFDAQADIAEMRAAIQATQAIQFQPVSVGELSSDTTQDDYCKMVEQLKARIFQGDAFQVVYGRMQSADFSGDAYRLYTILKTLNPSPYMFYMRDKHGALLGCSPELNISIKQEANSKREVVLTPIAGTKPRGFRGGVICPALDQRYAMALQTDQKELAEHTMLIDLARNDIAAIAKTGTTLVTDSFTVKKYSHVQHLVSRIAGELRKDVDPLTAYLATMNMGTLTGAPKVKAMQLIASAEENERGYFGGGFGFITHDGNMETTIIIRSMRIKGGKVYLRAGAGIVADSDPDSEYQETEAKMRACVRALEEAVKHD